MGNSRRAFQMKTWTKIEKKRSRANKSYSETTVINFGLHEIQTYKVQTDCTKSSNKKEKERKRKKKHKNWNEVMKLESKWHF